MKIFAKLIKSPNGDSIVLPKVGFAPMLLLEWLECRQDFTEFMVTEYDENCLQLHFRMPDFGELDELRAYINANI